MERAAGAVATQDAEARQTNRHDPPEGRPESSLAPIRSPTHALLSTSPRAPPRDHAALLRQLKPSGGAAASASLLQLQRLYGNHYVRRVLQVADRDEDEDATIAPQATSVIRRQRLGGWDGPHARTNAAGGAEVYPGSTSDRTAPVARAGAERLPTKLVVGPADDRDEREADATAQHIMRKGGDTCCPSCAEGKECRVSPARLQRPTAGVSAGAQVPADLELRIQKMQRGGEPLSSEVRAGMEPRFGRDFSSVLVHRDAEAAGTAQALGARAYTLGEHIAFNTGQYAPGTSAGDFLLAHELTHVAQHGARAPIGEASIRRFGLGDVWSGVEWAAGKAWSGTKSAAGAAWSGAEWAAGKTWSGLSWLGGKIRATAEEAWECAKATGRSLTNLVTLDVHSLADLLGLPEPQGGAPGTLRTVLQAVRHPCVMMIPGYGFLVDKLGPDKALAGLVALVETAWDVLQNPDPYLAKIQTALQGQVESALPRARSAAIGAVGNDYADCVLRHLNPKLDYLIENWWPVLKGMAWELIWPWPGVAKDFQLVWAHIKSMASNVWHLELNRAADDVLAILRLLNSAAGRLYGWFLIGAVLVGAVMGGIGGAAAGGVGAVPGALAGAGAGLGLAGDVGLVLLGTTLAIETASILKAAYNLSRDDRTDAEKECDCEQVAASSLVVGISLAMVILGGLAGRLGKMILQRIGRKAWRLPATRPAGRRSLRTRRVARRRGGADEGPGRESYGDVFEARFSLTEHTRAVFSRRQVKITDAFSTADNFPGIDLTDARIEVRSTRTGQLLQDLNAFDDAIANGDRLQITVDRGNIWQVKSHGRGAGANPAERARVIRNQIRSEIRSTASFTRNRRGSVVVQNPGQRTLVVFLEDPLPAADLANLQQHAAQHGVRLQIVTEGFPPGHPAVIPFEELPVAAAELSQGAARQTAGSESGGAEVECEPAT